MTILNYILIGTQIAVFCLAVISTVHAKIKGIDTKNENEELQKLLGLISKAVPDAIKTVEDMYPNATGEVKKSTAMDKLNLYAIKNGLTVSENYISALVEEFVELTKKVNVSRETDKIITGATNYGR